MLNIYELNDVEHNERDREADNEEDLSGRSIVEPTEEQVPDSEQVREEPSAVQDTGGSTEEVQIEKFKKRYREDCTNIGMLSPRDISSAILFLLSPAAKAINGHNLIVDDGWTL